MLFRLMVCLIFSGYLSAARSPAAAQRAEAGGTVSGVVYDSLARAPLAGATVQLVGSGSETSFARTTVSDELGRYAIADVPAGRFLLGFLHPLLDSLGLSVPVREVSVEAGEQVRADLAIPSSARIRAAACGPPAVAESGALAMGVVRDARTRAPLVGATVSGTWVELTVTRAGFTRSTPTVAATTQDNGWFALCGIPMPGTIMLVARRGADSTDVLELQVPAEGLLRRDLYLAASPRSTTEDTPRGDAGGRMSGTVFGPVGNQPLAGARVSMVEGAEAVANDQGEWTIASAPLGTRMLQVRAVGYYPEQAVVDVVAGAPPVRTTLSTMKAVLDTVRITASRLNDPHQSGFAERKQSGMGRYLTQEHVKRYQPLVTSDLFRFVSGVYVDRTTLGDARLSMRGIFTSRCAPAIYLDGHHMRGLSAEDINSWVGPDEIAGIEVYSAGMVPPQFTPGMGECGSIVIWTQMSTHGPDPRSVRRRFFTLIGGVALGLLFGATLK